MPRGRIHDQVTFLSLVPTYIAGLYLFENIGLSALLTLSTLIGALFLSPDLDTKSNNYYRWGFLRFIWIPYRKLVPHRSFLSHSLLLAPAFKLIYLSVCLLLVLMLASSCLMGKIDLYKFIIQGSQTIEPYYNYIIIVIIGIVWANVQHISLDTGFSIYNKLKPRL